MIMETLNFEEMLELLDIIFLGHNKDKQEPVKQSFVQDFLKSEKYALDNRVEFIDKLLERPHLLSQITDKEKQVLTDMRNGYAELSMVIAKMKKSRIDLPITTPVMLYEGEEKGWSFGYYAGNHTAKRFLNSKERHKFEHIVPIERFNAQNCSWDVEFDYGTKYAEEKKK